ncbi:GNAT family N-acetyltransferase [Pseudovibrio denitrificans]|nr:GNAT family N-acetyltransferase [Pseudovibrio denitrificans]
MDMSQNAAAIENAQVVLFEESDKQSLRDFLAVAWTEAHLAELGDDLTKRLVARLETDDLGGVVPGPDGQLHLAKIDEKIVGSLACAVRGEVVYIWACYLDSAYQGKGLARQLMKHAMADYSPDQVAGIYVLKEAEDAKRFYQKIGFIDCGPSELEVVPDTYTPAHIMQARIGNLKLD